MPVVSLDDLLGRNGSKIGTGQLQLPDSVVTHDSIDQMEFSNYADDSPRFRRIAVEDAPQVEVNVPEPDAIDFTSATREEIAEWQKQARAAKEAKDNAPPYRNWKKLTRDVFYSYHTHDAPEIVDGPVDPGVELHKRILPKLTTQDEHAEARNLTRDDPTMAAVVTLETIRELKSALTDELKVQVQEAQEYEDRIDQIEHIVDQIEDIRDWVRDYKQDPNNTPPPPPGCFPGGYPGPTPGGSVPGPLVDRLKQLVQQKRDLQQQAAQQAAQGGTPIDARGLQAIERAAKAGRDAAEKAGNLPSFGAGFGAGEPVYENPEQALAIAEMWANNPKLRAMAELFGRLDKDIRFKRSKRVVGGQDEIVDIEFGDNLNRVLPEELGLFADEDFEFDFLARYADAELMEFATVGEEHAGRGPIVVVLDRSYSMEGERNIWATAVSMCLLHIARLEKRDFALVEFSSGNQTAEWLFPAKAPMDAQQIIDMAAHFFGGGTTPINGVTAAVKLMENAAAFRKADLVMIGDGEAGFGPEDRRLRDQLIEKGVRLFGIGIGGTFQYLSEYCENVVSVHDFELTDPSAATAELATHIT